MPGSAAETRSRCMPFQRRRDPPGPGTAALLVRGRFSRLGVRRAVRLGVRLRPRLLVAAVVVGHPASTGPGGAPVGGATVVVRAGRAPASFWPALLACSFATFTAWRPRLETASQPASRPRPTSGRHHDLRAELRRRLRLCRDTTSASRPRWGCFAVSPISGPGKRAGPVERLARAPTRPYCPTCHRSARPLSHLRVRLLLHAPSLRPQLGGGHGGHRLWWSFLAYSSPVSTGNCLTRG
jgi:hypothetical protein